VGFEKLMRAGSLSKGLHPSGSRQSSRDRISCISIAPDFRKCQAHKRVFPGPFCKLTPACDRRGFLLFRHLAKASIEFHGIIALKGVTIVV
jgi:hypothetical protein